MECNYSDGETMVQYLQRVDDYVRALDELKYKLDEKEIIYTALHGLDQEANEALLQYLHLEQHKWTKAWIWTLVQPLEWYIGVTFSPPITPSLIIQGLIVGSGDLLQATGIGAITIKGKEGEVLNVKGVLHVPVLAALSCSQLARQGYACTFNMGECTVSKGGTVVMEAKLDKGLYIVPVCVPRVKRAHGVKAEKATCSTHWRDVEQVTADLLHVHMGHAGRQKLVECVKKGELKDVEIKEGGGQPSKCLDCTTGKVPSTSFPTSTTRASAPLELVHTHVCGAMQTPYREKGSKYFITFMDNYSRLGWVTLVESKDEVAKDFKHWIRYAEREAAAKMKILRCQQLLQQQLSKSPRCPMKKATWEEKLQILEWGEASPLRRNTGISQPPERFTPNAQYACMHEHEVHDLEECMLVDADGGELGLDF
ncbi:unnamed protein product [Closterium sp. NIES-54]